MFWYDSKQNNYSNFQKTNFQKLKELKKEVCDQTESLFQNDSLLKEEPDLIEKMKETMKRIIKLDSYLQHSSSSSPMSPSHLFNIESSSLTMNLIDELKANKYNQSPKISSAISMNTVNQSTKYLLRNKNQTLFS